MTRTALLGLLPFVSLLTGCMGGIRDTSTARAAEETLLVSTAAERAVTAYRAEHLAGKRVWLDESFFASIDKGYVISSLREHLSACGALLTDQEEQAELVVEVRNGTLGIDDPEWTVGIPAFPISAFDMAVVTPRLAIGYDPQYAFAKFQLWTYDAVTGDTLDLGEVWGMAQTGWFQSITPSVIGEVDAKVRVSR